MYYGDEQASDLGSRQMIVLEGLDACGKGTQAELLALALGARIVKYPVYETPSGQAIRGLFENPHPDPKLAAYSLQALQTVNRLETSANLWYLLGEGSLVLDRFTASALAYGAADGLDPEWLRRIHPVSLPQPTLQIFIDIGVEESFRRRPERADAYEACRLRLGRVVDAYWELFTNPPLSVSINGEPTAWRVVDGRGTIEQVHQRIMACVESVIK